MELPDTQKPMMHQEPDGDEGGDIKKKKEIIDIDISLIFGKGGMPHQEPDGDECMPCPPGDEDEECDEDNMDWKSIAKQLLQAVSMMDTHTDAYEDGEEEADGALKAIDHETSRVLWGKQTDDNPMSSYQNANYGATTANGLVMTNPAVTCNNDAYGKLDPDHDGDVDFNSAGDFIDTGKDEPHEGDDGIGPFRKAANDVIQKGSRGRNEKEQGKQKGSFGNSGSGKQERESSSEGEESESEESEMR